VSEAFTIQFDNGQRSRAAKVSARVPPYEVITLLGLQRARAAITIHAGAAGTSPEIIDSLKDIFHEQLAPLATRYQIVMLDGGTASGVVGMMGTARQATNGTFPLVGVAPLGKVTYPDFTLVPLSTPDTPLDDNHTHFALVDGEDWGTESWLLISLARALAIRRAVLLINGGEIVRHEALMHARAGNDLLVMAGSGRVADEIVTAIESGHSDDTVIRALLATGRAHICTPDTLTPLLVKILGLPDESSNA